MVNACTSHERDNRKMRQMLAREMRMWSIWYYETGAIVVGVVGVSGISFEFEYKLCKLGGRGQSVPGEIEWEMYRAFRR